MKRPEFIARQSKAPRGFLGWLIGSIMAEETKALNADVINTLQLAATDRVLEVGSGHGRTLLEAAKRLPAGQIVGIDISETMVRMAQRRCKRLIQEGRVQLEHGDSSQLTFPDCYFDKAFTVHTIYFWSNPVDHLRQLHRVLRSGGRLALGLKPKAAPGKPVDFPETVYTFYEVQHVADMLRTAGFSAIEVNDAASGMVIATALRA